MLYLIIRWFLKIIKYLIPIILLIIITDYSVSQSSETDDINTPVIQKESFVGTLYVIEPFSDIEKTLIVETAAEWNVRSHGVVQIDVEFEPFTIIDLSKGIFIMSVRNYDPDILLMDYKSAMIGSTLGLTSPQSFVPYIKIVPSRINQSSLGYESMFRAVMLHEIGHYIGLNHNLGPEGVGSLMYEGYPGASNHITKLDLHKLCDIYICDEAKKSKLFAEPTRAPFRLYLPQ